ncbi:hypothetical protein KA517_03425 [Candidatus Gracilibacteria bacterium]|nr:hypothetical protein [Candidatus Gracilibacteria bacterium]
MANHIEGGKGPEEPELVDLSDAECELLGRITGTLTAVGATRQAFSAVLPVWDDADLGALAAAFGEEPEAVVVPDASPSTSFRTVRRRVYRLGDENNGGDGSSLATQALLPEAAEVVAPGVDASGPHGVDTRSEDVAVLFEVGETSYTQLMSTILSQKVPTVLDEKAAAAWQLDFVDDQLGQLAKKFAVILTQVGTVDPNLVIPCTTPIPNDDCGHRMLFTFFPFSENRSFEYRVVGINPEGKAVFLPGHDPVHVVLPANKGLRPIVVGTLRAEDNMPKTLAKLVTRLLANPSQMAETLLASYSKRKK